MSFTELAISVEKCKHSKIDQVDWDNLPFGRLFSDHMLVMEYDNGMWQNPKISPFQSIDMHPAMSAIHYGQSIFEGLKAYRREDGSLSIFRPEMNAARFNQSALRMCMPEIPVDLFIESIRKLVEIDADWVPNKQGHALYIRPFMFATDEWVGIKPSESYKFLIILSPVGNYYAEPVRVKIEDYYTRAVQGGVGRAKVAGNYGASLFPAKKAQDLGFHQLVWTDAKEHKFIEESGTMNIVFQINGTLITPTEDDDTILRGITKRSIIEIANHWGIPVEERKVSVEEILTALRNGTLEDAFGAGTAATLAQIAVIGYKDEVFTLPDFESRSLSNKIKYYIDKVKIGAEEDVFGWNHSV
ncbi:MAG: branched-chain amino acid aminotransferase [Flavobacteriia bacterium]|nr:branched-chain amino acid aminotransferase [Flavobacteriia bacterium]